jgi:hypothetical protein
MRRNHGEAQDTGASKEHRAASAGRWPAVAFPSAAALYCLMAGCGRTGAMGVPHRVAPRASGQRHASQAVSTKSLGEVQRRRMTRIEAPQVGQRAACGGRGVRGGSGTSPGCPCTHMRRRVASGRAQRACRKPQWRTFCMPSGKTWWRHLRSNAMTSRGVVRRRALPTFREVQVTVWSWKLTRRGLAMATVKP